MAVPVRLGGTGMRKPPMNRIIAEIEAEIHRLQAARALLARETNARKVGKPGKRKRSAATRAKMAAAQRARWARAKAK
jgi:hypothetical protein